MHFSTLAAVAAIAPLVSAHGGMGLPKIAGINMRDLKSRDLLANLEARIAEVKTAHAHENRLAARQDDRQCGAGIGSCAAGQCCSGAGYCGTEDDYCYSPGCDYEHGPGCPENVTPSGTNTSSIARTKVGNVAYGGAGIYNCVTPGTVALTYDDGPQKEYTEHVMDVFKTYGGKATFFITGNNINKGQIDITPEHAAAIKRMDAEGHQIASHTWTHLDLSAVSSTDRKQQMWKNEMALRNIVGKIPTYMRPPYSSCTAESGCEKDLADLGYHVTYFDVDTDDYNQDDVNKIQNSKNYFKGNVTANGASAASSQWLAIGHDIHYQTVYNLTDYMLSTITQLGYKSVTVGECLGDPEANWYRAADGAGTQPSGTQTSTAAAPTGTNKVSTDGNCGSTAGSTCLGSTFGNCCSQYNYCGSTTDHCGTGCQSGFGNCGGNGAVSSKAATSTVKPATSTVKTSAAPTATTASKVSTDGTCAGTGKQTCAGSTFGNCCSQSGWCGSTTDYCGTGCQTGFGTCGSLSASKAANPTSTKPAATSAAAKKISTDGTCAGTGGFTCQGSTFGNCCSQYGWCGSTTGHCTSGCQSGFGTCS
ncbi:hypothetical protein B5807_00423 [Epicoccum nigrum]|uniref:NodB homology domain-containing protein n=1 Tax=Epicoccum nigrum TaxID=105696 RepID=A0A1Y2MFK4_EPING|nr:hypothetical protein B5807_00423 [Epicoccum nigrum]